MFIARISKGRTIREFICVVMFIPLVFSLIWFSSFGETAIFQNEQNIGNLSEPQADISLVLFYMLDSLIFPIFSSIFALSILVLFFVTSSDSGSLVISTISSGGNDSANRSQRVLWAFVQGLLACTSYRRRFVCPICDTIWSNIYGITFYIYTDRCEH